MKLRKLLFRSKKTVEVDEVQLWYVRWTSRYGGMMRDTKKEVKAFPNYDDALEFKQALEDAFKLIRHTHGNKVTLTQES